MKKILIATTILSGLGLSLAPVASLYAQEAAVSADASQSDWLAAINTRIDLAQAKVSLLTANVALEIDNAPAQASIALQNAETSVLQAKQSATADMRTQLDVLAQSIHEAQAAIADSPDKARTLINEAISTTQTRLQEFQQTVQDSDEAKLLHRRYAQLEARAALLNAQLAEKLDETGDLARKHLDEAAAWYQSAKAGASDALQSRLQELSSGIDNAKHLMDDERGSAADAITNLANRASNLVRGQ